MDSRRGRSRRKSRRCGFRCIRDRRLGMLLAIIIFASAIFDMPFSWSRIFHGPSSVFASSGKDAESLWATASNARVKEGKRQDVDIYVISEDNDVSPGNTSVMTIYLKNNTDQAITDGKLTFSSRYILPENGAFVDYQLDEDEEAWEAMEAEQEDAEAAGDGAEESGQDEAGDVWDAGNAQDAGNVQEVGAVRDAVGTIQDSGNVRIIGTVQDTGYETGNPVDEEDTEETEEAPGTLTGIDLEPGEWHELYFEFYTEDDLGPQRASVTFRFVGEGEEEMIRSTQKFYYGIGLPNVNLELTGGDQVETGILQEMNIWMTEPSWSSWVTDEKDETEWELASNSDGKKASPSAADKTASPSEASREEASDTADEQEKKDRETIKEYEEKAMDISEAKVRYEVEIFGTEFRKFRPRKAEEVEDIGWINCVYQLAQDARPGIYYGKVKALGRWQNEKFVAEQGFLFEVTGEGTITLEDRIDGMQIQISGPASSFPEADKLTLETGKITEEEQGILDGMILNEGQSVNVLHFRLLADGEEKPLTGPVTVRLSGKKIEENAEGIVEALEENTAEIPEESVPTASGFDALLEADGADGMETMEGMETAEEAVVLLPERILRQGPGVAAAYMAGEEITATRRIADNGTLIIRAAGNDLADDEYEEAPEEEIIADGQQVGIALLAVNLEYGQLEELECGITDQKRIQVETDVLPAAYVITDVLLEETPVVQVEADNVLTYEDEDVKVTVTLPKEYAAALGGNGNAETETGPKLKLAVKLIASCSTARPAADSADGDGEEIGGDNSYSGLMSAAQEALSHRAASAVFLRISIISGSGNSEAAAVDINGNTDAEGLVQTDTELGAGEIRTEVWFKKKFLDTRTDGELNVLRDVSGEWGEPEHFTPEVEYDDNGQVDSVVYSYTVSGVNELKEDIFGIVWTADFMGVNTGGPGTVGFAISGMALMLGALWIWEREKNRKVQS